MSFDTSGISLTDNSLTSLRILVLEDEFLIAMYIEELCRDHGASDVVICTKLRDANDITEAIDAAIVDLMLGGESTLPLARTLRDRGIPFIFASGYMQRRDVTDEFPGVPMVGKPYSGTDLVDALADAIRRRSALPSG